VLRTDSPAHVHRAGAAWTGLLASLLASDNSGELAESGTALCFYNLRRHKCVSGTDKTFYTRSVRASPTNDMGAGGEARRSDGLTKGSIAASVFPNVQEAPRAGLLSGAADPLAALAPSGLVPLGEDRAKGDRLLWTKQAASVVANLSLRWAICSREIEQANASLQRDQAKVRQKSLLRIAPPRR